MLLRIAGLLALLTATTTAFKDTSPFFLFSTSELLASSPPLVAAKHLTDTLSPHLERCASDTYIIVSQPGVSVVDYQNPGVTPHLRKSMLGNDKNIRSSIAVKEVLGQVDAVALSEVIQDKCGAGHQRVDASTGSFVIADNMRPWVINLDFPAPPTGASRLQTLIENGNIAFPLLPTNTRKLIILDAFLASVLDLLSSNKYTVIYTTSPTTNSPTTAAVAEPESYEMDSIFQAPVHMDLKRDLSHHHRRASDQNITLPNGPLFERYQYLNPGLFMGLLVAVLLISILYVGINGVASLQVSYSAFDKEMGPAAQKKQG
ncbi:hypothetical protein ACLMJK_005769 [Lecanora helva]